MRVVIRKFSMIGLVVGVTTLVITSPASAHVTVKPSEAVTADFQTFAVSVPNEKNIPTTSIKIAIPKGVQHVTPTQKTGWFVNTEKTNIGDQSIITAVSWSGGQIAEGLRDEFTFSAQVPKKSGVLEWKAYQTYSDSTVVSWDKPEGTSGHDSENPNEGPFSVTRVISEASEFAAAKKSDQAAADAKTIANRSLYVAVTGVMVGLAGIFLAIRKKS